MARAQIDNASTAEAPADAACDFPSFEELFPRQAARGADGARDAMEMRVVGEAGEIVAGETRFRGWGEHAVRVPGSEFWVLRSGSWFREPGTRTKNEEPRTQN